MSSEARSEPGAGHVGPLLSARCTGCEKTSEKRTTDVVGDRANGSFQHVCHTCQLITWWNVLEVLDDKDDLSEEVDRE
ncbi:hypothetical protein DJ71_06525 [Halorubrum sp. E3]|uniref:Uncharacterized protein n=1 Tax=Halorubrum persicum TaxID=1383844 RepID=A0A2G1WKH4_9EURY|nr:hypothetical protein [Halorubrum persicum]OYR86295.1 hypothetical protein DJ71_06525 [Halorubrum sp. E3]PHQ39445.1 hypothetical protein DJ69_06045 [Halorubrum persicum]